MSTLRATKVQNVACSVRIIRVWDGRRGVGSVSMMYGPGCRPLVGCPILQIMSYRHIPNIYKYIFRPAQRTRLTNTVSRATAKLKLLNFYFKLIYVQFSYDTTVLLLLYISCYKSHTDVSFLHVLTECVWWGYSDVLLHSHIVGMDILELHVLTVYVVKDHASF